MGSLLPTTVMTTSSGKDSGPTAFQKLASALFYAATSIFLVFVNKSVLTFHHFPAPTVLGIGQMVSAIIILYILRGFRIVSFPRFSRDIPRKLFPLPLLYLANMLTGLKSTKSLSLPMFTVLRRFSILLTMLMEFLILKAEPARMVISSVLIMIFGAIVAASNDLAFDFTAYALILSNDLFTALYGVYTKKRLSSDLGKYGLLYYNSLFSLPIMVAFSHYNGELELAYNFAGWSSMSFYLQYLSSCVVGFVLMYSVMMCTHYNSPLTTTVTGCMKNLFVTYAGMVLPGGDYVYSAVNFIGINISVAGSLIYSYVAFKTKNKT